MADKIENSGVRLKRVLSLRDLIIYGIILIQPVAALPLFGHANEISKGHAVTTILLAMFAMIFTAISYGRMANRYPLAGSAYTYVSKGLHPALGFITGWSMIMDYVFIPVLCVIFSSVTAYHLFPFLPYFFWILLFATGFCFLNLKGIRVASQINLVMMVIMSIVVFYFMAAAIHFIYIEKGVSGLLTVRPFYDPKTFDLKDIGSATALAALTYIGFDGLTTLSEEAKNPKRNIMIAAVMTCVITGIWSSAQIYLSQVAWPDWHSFSTGISDSLGRRFNLDTAILAVANRVGDNLLDVLLSATLLIGSIGSGITGQMGAGRLLYGMGRDGVIPKKFFSHLDKKNAIPKNNVILIGILTLIGALILNYEESARLINFGAFFAFMGVNIACIREYFFLIKKKTVRMFVFYFLFPLIGFIVCFIIWINLPLKTFYVGGSWLAAGAIYLMLNRNKVRNRANPVDN